MSLLIDRIKLYYLRSIGLSCSAGIGRTGTVIVISMLMSLYISKGVYTISSYYVILFKCSFIRDPQKSCSQNLCKISSKTFATECNFFIKLQSINLRASKFVLSGGFFPWNFINVFTIAVLQNTSECLLLTLVVKKILNQSTRNKIYFKTNFFVKFLSLFCAVQKLLFL